MIYASRLCCATAVAAAAVLSPSTGRAQHAHHHASGSAAKAAPECAEPVLKCASKVTPAVGRDGSILLVFQAAGRILFTRTVDAGKSFSEPVAVSREAGDVDWGPDARPKVAVDGKARIHVAFAVFKDKHFNGQVLHAVSSDDGKSFSEPAAITTDATSQRFETLTIAPDGRVFAAWLDKRNRTPARARGEAYAGAALAYAWTNDEGRFEPARIAVDQTCECCRLAVSFDRAGRPLVLFRNVFEGGIRDHAVATLGETADLRRVSTDGWKTDACPHHGPSMATAPDGIEHVVWFTNGAARKGLFYARSNGASSFSPPKPIGDPGHTPSRPAIIAAHDRVHLVWKEFDGKLASVVGMVSSDGGLTWSDPKTIATTTADSDHPLLLTRGADVYLSWQTEADGYRLIPLEVRS